MSHDLNNLRVRPGSEHVGRGGVAGYGYQVSVFGFQKRHRCQVPGINNWGRPNDGLFGSNLDDQYTMEVYYRLQVAKEFSITPDIQFLINPALNPQEDNICVFGLRARLSF